MELKSLGDLALLFAALPAHEAHALNEGLEKCAKQIEKTAQDEIGHYQSAVGPFQDWAELAESTEADKASKGYPANAPLLRTGEMRDSIKHEVDGLEAVIGSTDEKMAYHEFGTNRIPPRPVMGPAVFRNKEFIQKTIGQAAISGLFGGDRIHPSLGYDME